MKVWVVLQSFWFASRSVSCRQWRSLFLVCYCFPSLLLAGVVLCWRCKCERRLTVLHFCLLNLLKIVTCSVSGDCLKYVLQHLSLQHSAVSTYRLHSCTQDIPCSQYVESERLVQYSGLIDPPIAPALCRFSQVN
jgi:hypothetical protein